MRDELRAVVVLFGACRLGEPVAGDAERTATFRLHGERGDVDLVLECDAAGVLTQVRLRPLSLTPPR